MSEVTFKVDHDDLIAGRCPWRVNFPAGRPLQKTILENSVNIFYSYLRGLPVEKSVVGS